MKADRPEDGRKYHIGDKVDFTSDEGEQVPGIVHAVRYQQGKYELIGAQRPDMHSPEGPDNLPIPGTGHMELVSGTESQKHSFEYIMVHQHEHKAWWETEQNNIGHIKAGRLEKVKPHPPLKQHIRIFEEDA